MKPYFIKTPNLIKIIFNKWIWSFNNKEKVLFLTFDDGPTPEITNWTLDQLNKFNAKATFFCIGKNVVQHPEIFQNIVDNNHSIGNHTNNHLNGIKYSAEAYIKNFKKAQNNIPYFKTKLFRPPYGRLTLKQGNRIRKQGYKIIMWDVLSADFDQSISLKKCFDNVVKNAKNGSIIVFHDSLKASKNLQNTLPKVLEYYSSKGYTFKSIS
ncbi:polysaccharide deacetylase family protein [uncultured Lutibacter sp.]|uniref:polysaccharide deacetylase family protein n=1 Tax=uncultured Lutibacter sp. TaxID=437739 RepID=UPI00262B6488|nr:polysaccharide deacetylase family protein [uncultured Lutibacter sp.]